MRIGSDQCSPFASHRGLRGRRSPAFGKAQNEPTAAGLPATSSRATAYKAGRCAIVRITVTTGSSVGSPPPMRGTARRRLTPVDAGLTELTYVDRSRDLAKRTHGCLRPRLDHRADLFLLFSAKLPAGRVDVSSATFADVGIHAGVAEDLLERDDVVGLRPLVRQRRDLVVADQVHVRAHRAADFHKLAGEFGLVVHAGEQDVLERDLAAGLVEVEAGGVQDAVDLEVRGPGDAL